MDRPTLKLKTNLPTTGTLQFDTPKEGESKFGPYHLYALNVNGEEMGWFATDMAHEVVQFLGLKKGDKITILKEEFGDDGKTHFVINGKTNDDIDRTGMTVGEATGQADDLQSIINTIDGGLIRLQALANTQGKPLEDDSGIPF